MDSLTNSMMNMSINSNSTNSNENLELNIEDQIECLENDINAIEEHCELLVNQNRSLKTARIVDKDHINRNKNFYKLLKEDIIKKKEKIELLKLLGNTDTITVYTQCPQSGKTLMIIQKMDLLNEHNISPILLSPNKLSLQEQTIKRIITNLGISPKRTDSKAKCNKLDVSQIDSKPFILSINNKSNLSLIIVCIVKQISQNKKTHLIIDEFHNVLPKKINNDFALSILNKIQRNQEVTVDELKDSVYSAEELMYLIFRICANYKTLFGISGYTATVFSAIKRPIVPILAELGINIHTKKGIVPYIYIG